MAINKIVSVVKGDSLSKIAKMNNISIYDLMESNKLKDINRLEIGQKIVIPISNSKYNQQDSIDLYKTNIMIPFEKSESKLNKSKDNKNAREISNVKELLTKEDNYKPEPYIFGGKDMFGIPNEFPNSITPEYKKSSSFNAHNNPFAVNRIVGKNEEAGLQSVKGINFEDRFLHKYSQGGDILGGVSQLAPLLNMAVPRLTRMATTPPNKQKLGNIEFDSDKTRWHNSGKYLIAKDEKSGKDYGIVRKEDGSYDFFRGIDNKLKDKEYFKNAEKGLYEFAYNKVFNEEVNKRKYKQNIEFPQNINDYKIYDVAKNAIDTSGIFNDIKNNSKYKYAVDKISHLEAEEEELKSDKFSKLLGVYQKKDNRIKINPTESDYSKENTMFHEAMHDISNDPNVDSKKWTYGLPGNFNKGYRNYYQPEKKDNYLDDDNENYSRVAASFFDLSKMGVNLMQTPYSEFNKKDKDFIKNTISNTTNRSLDNENSAQSLISSISSSPVNQNYFYDGTKTNAWDDMKNKLKTGQLTLKYNQGGDILGGVSQLAPLLNMAVPGLGTGVSAIAGLGAKYFNDQEMKAKQAEAALNNPANYSNQNAFGYADGGMLSGLAQGAGLVTGAPNQVDGNQMNYKGSPIALNHGETLDTNKDRVISANYFNPVTGKKIVDEDKALKRSRGKAENILKNGTDSAAMNTIKYTQQQEDALFRMQEMIAQMAGDRNRPQDQQQQMSSQMPQQGYKAGGNIMKYKFAGGIPHPPEWYAQHVNDDLTFKPQPIGVPKANPAYKQYNVFNQAPVNKYSYTDPAVNAQSYWGNNFDVKAGKSAYNAFAIKQNLLNKGVKDYVASPILKDNNIYDQAAHNALFESKLGKELFSDTSPFTNRQSSDGKTLYSFTGQGVKGNPIQYTTEGDTTPKTLPDGTEFNPLSGLYGTASSIAGNMTPEQLNAIGGEDFIASQRPTLTEEEATQMNGKINPNGNSNFWTQSTQGEKIGMLGQGASLLAKGIESFQPLQQQQTRPNTSPISLTQLDPSAILNRNQQSYQSALAQAQGNTSNQNVGYQQSLFANKLAADNQALSQFQGQNASLKDNYEQRLAQRQDSNNANANQVDDIMARRRGARENMRMGVYGDVATMGMNVGQLMNTRLGNQATVGMMRGIAPDVYENQIKNMSPELKRYFGITK